jgi:hypothetical protein
VEATRALAAAVGPGIGPCCYEVDEPVLAAFEELGPEVATDRMLDLRMVARLLLERAGVGAIEVCELCTSCNPHLFFSHRRDHGRTGRQAGLVWASDRAGQASQPAATKALQPASGSDSDRSSGEAGCGRIRASSDHRSPSAPWEDVGGGVQRCPA